jgi:hypothetical protein
MHQRSHSIHAPQTLKRLQEAVERQRAAPAPFAFRRRAPAEPTSTPAPVPMPAPVPVPGDRGGPEPAVLPGSTDLVVVVEDAAVAGRLLLLRDLARCEVRVPGRVAGARLVGLRECTVHVAAAAGAVFVDDCRACTFILCCHQVGPFIPTHAHAHTHAHTHIHTYPPTPLLAAAAVVNHAE